MSNTSGISGNVNEISFLGSKTCQSRSVHWATREGDVRAKIFKMTRERDNISFVYRESLRGMMASINDIVYLTSDMKSTDIKVMHANAERAVAKLTQENNIILPVISIAQTTTKDDDSRRRNESILVHEKVWDEEKRQAFRVLSLAPRPVNIQYDINIWCKYRSDMDQILEQVRLKFNPEMQVPTKFSTLAKAHIISEDDTGSVEAADKEDRLIRKRISVVLRTYIPSPRYLVTATGEITEFNADVFIPKSVSNDGSLGYESDNNGNVSFNTDGDGSNDASGGDTSDTSDTSGTDGSGTTGGTEDLTFNFDISIIFDQHYLNSDAGEGSLGSEANAIMRKTINIDSADTFVRDEVNGMSFLWKYASLPLNDSYIPGSPTFGIPPDSTLADFETLYDQHSDGVGYLSDNKALGIHACVVEHDEFPGSFEVNVMLTNGFQAVGFVYGNSLSVTVTENVTGETRLYKQTTPLYFRTRACLPVKLSFGADRASLINCTHYDMDETDLVPRPTAYRDQIDGITAEYDIVGGGTYKKSGFVQPWFMGNKNMGSSTGGNGIAPYWGWRKGRPGARLWRREMMGEITRSEIAALTLATGEPLLINGEVNGATTGTKLIIQGGDPYWGGSDNKSFHLAGYNEYALGLGSGLNTSNLQGTDPVAYNLFPKFNDTNNNLRSWLDDGIFHGTFLRTAVGGNILEPRDHNATKWTRHAHTHLSREYRAAAELARKDPLARLWMKFSFWNVKQWFSQTRFDDDSSTLTKSINKLTLDAFAPGGDAGGGTTWGDRGFSQPTRLITTVNRLNAECTTGTGPVPDAEAQVSRSEVARAVDAGIHTNYGFMFRKSVNSGQALALKAVWLMNPQYANNFNLANLTDPTNQDYRDSSIRLSRGFQAQLFASLLRDIEEGTPGNIGLFENSTAEPGKTINARLLEKLGLFRTTFPSTTKVPNWFEPEWMTNWIALRDAKEAAVGTLGGDGWFGSLVPSDDATHPLYPTYWATRDVALRCSDSFGRNETPMGFFGGNTEYPSGLPCTNTNGSFTYTNLDDGSSTNGANNIAFNNTDGKDRYYHGMYHDAIFMDKTLIVDEGIAEGSIQFGGYSDTLGWDAAGSDVWEILLDQKMFLGGQNVVAHEYLDSTHPSAYQGKLRPMSEA